MEKESKIHIFVYGTLLSDKVLACLDLKPLNIYDAIIMGFKRIPVRGAVYPTAIEQPSCFIQGKVYEITKHDIEMLDVYEGIE